MRGGVSKGLLDQKSLMGSSPHAWGCFPGVCFINSLLSVFPTCVGVFLDSLMIFRSSSRLPHMRGGVSMGLVPPQGVYRSSPHAWGCFYSLHSLARRQKVFPTCVGVFLDQGGGYVTKSGLPHMRGGVSHYDLFCFLRYRSSPHAWGCFLICGFGTMLGGVFPTCVGVFLKKTQVARLQTSLPHMRGGVSLHCHCLTSAARSSPHAWGCFSCIVTMVCLQVVFPTCVGVFPTCLSSWNG